jgi:hypothetical protein
VRRPLALAAALALAGAAVALRVALEPAAGEVGKVRNPTWLPDGRLLRIASLGNRLALSDLYWLRLVQYVGEQSIAGDGDWAALYPLADLTTDLDPRHAYAYQIAGSNLSGLASRYGEASRILLKGMRNLPDRWQLPFVHAVNKFLYEGDFAEAAVYARRASEIGKRPHLALLAANLSLVTDEEGEYGVAESFLQEALRQADTPELKEQLAARLVKVRTYHALSGVEGAVARFERDQGRRPASIAELVSRGYLREHPADPSGGRIQYDPAGGNVRSSVLGERRPYRNTLAPERR